MPKRVRIILAVGICVVAFLVAYFAATPSLSKRPGQIEFDKRAGTEDEPFPVDPLAVAEDAESAAPHAAPDAPVEPVPTEQPAEAELPPGFTIHVVRRHETMQSIAEAVYGDAAKWTLIAHENPLQDPIKLVEGTELRLPPADHQRPGEPVEIDGLPQALVIHVVKKNETLGHIAQLYYGRASKWRLIYDANRDKLRTPDMVRAGMKLTIPPDFEELSGG